MQSYKRRLLWLLLLIRIVFHILPEAVSLQFLCWQAGLFALAGFYFVKKENFFPLVEFFSAKARL